MSETVAEKKVTKKAKKSKSGRVFKANKMIYHDLFKLHVSNMKKNVSWQRDILDLKDVEHVHFFHTYDSSGKKQTSCVPTGGHFHLVETEDQGEGLPPKIVSVSGPMVWGNEKDRYTGKRRRIPVPYLKDDDNHTHDIEYIESSEIKVRSINAEAVKTIGKVEGAAQKPSWVK
jgi:hypothetical protein